MFMATIDSSRSVTFSWRPVLLEEQNGVIVSYTINIAEAGSGETIQRVITSSSQINITVNSLVPFTTYFCSIAASNSIGIGPFSTILTVSTPEDSK